MAKVTREYTLELTLTVRTKEDEDEINHDELRDGLLAMFPVSQEQTIKGKKIRASVVKRSITRNY